MLGRAISSFWLTYSPIDSILLLTVQQTHTERERNMNTFKLTVEDALIYFKRQKALSANDTYVIEWRDGKTNEVYNVSGKAWDGQGPGAGQILKYLNFLVKKDRLVKARKANSAQFFEFIMEQNDGVKKQDRGTGFASRFPNGVELDVVLAVSEFSPEEAARAQSLYRSLRKKATIRTRIKLTVPDQVARSATVIKPQQGFTVSANTARNISILKAA